MNPVYVATIEGVYFVAAVAGLSGFLLGSLWSTLSFNRTRRRLDEELDRLSERQPWGG
jgi:hypothetical protein